MIPSLPAPDPEIAALILIVPPVSESVASPPDVLLIAAFTVSVFAVLLPVEIDTFVPTFNEVFMLDAKIYDEAPGTKLSLYAVPLEEFSITTS